MPEDTPQEPIETAPVAEPVAESQESAAITHAFGDELSDIPTGPAWDRAAEIVPEQEVAEVELVEVPEDPATEEVPVVEAKVEDTPAPSAITQAHADILLELAKREGVTETDVAKIPEALATKRAEVAETVRIAAVTESEAKLTTQIAESVTKDIDAINLPAVLGQMKMENFNVDEKDWWKAETWGDDTTGPEMLARFNEIQAAMRAEAQKQPEWESIYQAKLSDAKGKIATDREDFEKIATEYKVYPKELVTNLKAAGVNNAMCREIARHTAMTVDQHTATLNSAVTEKDAELITLREQVSAHPAQLVQAKADALKEALAQIEAGRTQPNTLGNGVSQIKTPAYNPKSWLDDIPTGHSV